MSAHSKARRPGPAWLSGLIAATLSLSAADASAQATSADGQRARDLASRGRAAFDRGDLAAGCPLLDEAYRLDGQLLGAGFALAECREKEGKLATAHRTFLEIAEKAAARKEARADEAKARAAALAPRLSHLQLDLSEKAAARGDLIVEIDGAVWPRARWAAPEPVDGGAHEITARAGGVTPWSGRVDVATEGATIPVVVPFDRDASAPAPAPKPAPQEPVAAEGGGFPWKTAGLVTGAVGVGLVGASVVVGLVAKGNYDAVESDCDGDNACTPAAATARDDARGLAGVGTVLFIGGAVLATAGVTAFVFGPDGDEGSSSASAVVRVGPGGVGVTGRF